MKLIFILLLALKLAGLVFEIKSLSLFIKFKLKFKIKQKTKKLVRINYSFAITQTGVSIELRVENFFRKI